MTATKTRKRSKKVEEAEQQAQGLAAMADGPIAETIEDQLAAESDADESADVETIAPEVQQVVAKATNGQAVDDARKAKAFDEIAELNDAVEKAFTTWSIADKRSKDLKKSYEGAVAELRSVISKTAHPAPMPLFDGKSAAAGESEGNEPTAPTTEVNPPDDAWRNVPLREALPELTESVGTKLEAAQLFTRGELANWTAESGGRRRLTDIAGVGSGTAGKIEEATMAFWSRYRPAPVTSEPAVPMSAWEAAAATPIGEFKIEDGPRMMLEAAGIKTFGDLDARAMREGLSIFDTCRGIGLESAEADDVVKAIDAAFGADGGKAGAA